MGARPGDAVRAAQLDIEMKAGVVRGFTEALTERGWLTAVTAELSPGARQMLLNPPPATSWIDGRGVCEVQGVIYDLHGVAAVRAVARRAVELTTAKLTRTFTQGLLRLFGATPATLFARLQTYSEQSTRGIRWEYTPTGATSGVLECAMFTSRNVPMAVFEGSAGQLETVYDVCTAKNGVIESPQIQPDAAQNRARFVVRWT